MDESIIVVEKIDNVWMRVTSRDEYVLMEIFEFFTFEVPGYRFMPSYRNGLFDGFIRLYNLSSKRMYLGLLGELIKFASSRNYPIVLNNLLEVDRKEISLVRIQQFVKNLHLTYKGEALDIRDYQIEAIRKCLNSDRALILSPTSSGKSLIIYCVIMWYLSLMPKEERILLVVPNLNLIEQMFFDFVNYGSQLTDMSAAIHKIFGGQEKYQIPSYKRIVISTWHSIFKEQPEWFKPFRGIFFDEAHSCKADALKGILEKATHTPNRYGFTGTLDDAKVNSWVLQGLFGDVHKIISTNELMERGQVSNLKIKCLLLSYPDEIRKASTKLSYQDEIAFINSYNKRNDVVISLLKTLREQNTLVLFNRIESQGKPFFERCEKEFTDMNVLYIAGDVKSTERERMRNFTEDNKKVLIIASSGTMSTGVSITNLHNIVFLSTYKSKIKTLQSIGRVLRKNPNKEIAVVYDIVDDLSWKSRKNYTLSHFFTRIKIYDLEKFNYKIYPIKL